MEPVPATAEGKDSRSASRLMARFMEEEDDYVRFIGFVTDIVAPRLSEVVSDERRAALFSSLPDIVRAERSLIVALAAAADADAVAVLAQHWAAHLEPVYRPYVANYARAAVLFAATARDDADFARELLSLSSSPEAAELVGELSVPDLLALPLMQPALWCWRADQLALRVPAVAPAARELRERVHRTIAAAMGAAEQTDAQQRAALAAVHAEYAPLQRSRRAKLLHSRVSSSSPSSSSSSSPSSRVLLAQCELQYRLPRDPHAAHPARLLLCSDALLLLDNGARTLVATMAARAVVVSPRHEPRVGDVTAAARDASFSLFWNRGRGRIEHFVLLAPNAETRAAWLAQIQRVLFDALNTSDAQTAATTTKKSGKTGRKETAGENKSQSASSDAKARRVQYHLVRERKPGQGRSNDYGAEYHFMIWGFGSSRFYRCDPDTGARVAEYDCTELEAFHLARTGEGESRLLVRTTWETFELSTQGAVLLVYALRALMKRKLARGGVRIKSRRKQQQQHDALMPSRSTGGQRAMAADERAQLEDRVRRDTTAALEARVRDRLRVVQGAYDELSAALWRSERDAAQLQRQLAARNAPSPRALVAAGMTPAERQQYAAGRGPLRAEDIMRNGDGDGDGADNDDEESVTFSDSVERARPVAVASVFARAPPAAVSGPGQSAAAAVGGAVVVQPGKAPRDVASEMTGESEEDEEGEEYSTMSSVTDEVARP